jgi:nitroreductase
LIIEMKEDSIVDVLQAIKERRSIRQYSQKPVSENQLNQILQAGRWAPSRGNSQPWKFILLDDDKIRRELAEAIPTGKFLAQAAQGIAVVVNPEVSKHPEQEGAAAIQNMLLAAHALGLGTCWISVWGTDWVKTVAQILGIPEGEWCISIVSIGYPAEAPEKGRKGLDELTFANKYGLH